MSEPSEAVLCYAVATESRIWAYFTTRSLDDQWGDSWGVAPYEHNAGLPYDADDERVIHARCITGHFTTPADLGLNSPFSVQAINSGVIAWLWSCVGDSGRPGGADRYVVIPAGVTMVQCCELVWSAGGEVDGLPKPEREDAT